MAATHDYDEQDVAEVFDEDNTNEDGARTSGHEDAEQFEDLVDVFDVTSKAGDADADEPKIAEDLDDDDLVASAKEDDDADLEDDNLRKRDGDGFKAEDPGKENDLGDDDPDLSDGIDDENPNEVELTYAGDLNNMKGAASSAADMESDELSDDDLEALDYKE